MCDVSLELRRGFASEWAFANYSFPQRDAKRKLVGTRVGEGGEVLLGRHVAGGPHNGARLGQLERCILPRVKRAVIMRVHVQADQAEVHHFRLAVFGNHEVRRRKVSVDQTRLVRRC
ncbi:MAG: hypothetical protein V3V08_06310 [Nannocystaceae bacterium]